MKNPHAILFVLFAFFIHSCGDEENINNIITPPVIIDTTIEIDGWVLEKSGVNKNLYSVFMVNENTGYITGASGTILHTTNSGINWNQQLSGTYYDLLSVYFTTAAGWAVGSFGAAVKTTNGGEDWLTASGLGSRTLYCVLFYDENTGWVSGDLGRIYRTTDGGSNWIAGNGLQMVPVYSLYFTDNLTGYASCFHGYIYKTIDGGVNWIQIKDITPYVSFKTIYVNSSGSGFTAGDQFWGTNNYGNNWSIINNVAAGRIESLNFPDGITGYGVSASSMIIKTTDSGNNWLVKNSDINKYFYDVNFVNVNTGWLTAEDGLIFKTTTGGN